MSARVGESFEPPYRVPGTVGAGTVADGHEHLAAGEGSGIEVAVAGRVMRNRPQGKVSFAELRDWSGSIQLFATAGGTEEFDQFVALSLGDWVGVRGEIVRTRRGELSVSVKEWSLLAEARRGFGDKWKGVADVEIRSRQREVDLWANEGVRERFLLRSRVVQSLRTQLWGDGYIEVETPMLQPLAGGGTAKPFTTEFHALHSEFFLRIAPELYLKRLLVGGFERVFELGRVFRNEGLSPRHNPEFTMLEIYEAYADYKDMARLIERLVATVATELFGSPVVPGEAGIDLAGPWPELTMEEAIEQVTGEAVALGMGETELRKVAAKLGAEIGPARGAGGVLYEIYERTTEASLTGPVHVIDYPEEVSPLARRHRSKAGYVERLTPIIGGREIAEAYSELVDPDDQRARFMDQVEKKKAGDDEAMPLDEEFLRALEHGMPPAGGVGIGVDRLVMALAGVANIRDVVLFPALRPIPASESADPEG
ncbi:MAG TPA: lysine--tRNA ligase [Acidimicrobiales bacterium]|nr:lysine--tRNA ligase [Acidimicrobiales bacterium]